MKMSHVGHLLIFSIENLNVEERGNRKEKKDREIEEKKKGGEKKGKK